MPDCVLVSADFVVDLAGAVDFVVDLADVADFVVDLVVDFAVVSAAEDLVAAVLAAVVAPAASSFLTEAVAV
ncbi:MULTISPECIES: hypothetical protein [unclassified Paenibacillus]|uniref:hypothetical protein n=1 Tax=unclassified Paenibacillus TaxID=185978 RepID=UPI001B442B34|nr:MULTISPECIES: hypothetical protein [unclassified Paenibacillus]MBP1157424.1 hypothetical protein [Paenibacillus sp. PvP091]MBP1171838.1 hypothetical protein [Paenibacillus sp. PvR098]MBP2438219.1 hypothetical protein [Paenibacillus sp. PvP052]